MNEPVFTIDLDDAAFQQFAETFKRFQEQAAAMSSQWRASDEIIAQAMRNFEIMTQPLPLGEAVEHVDKIGSGFASSATFWAVVVTKAKIFGGAIHEGTLSLAKWTGLTSVFSGILAAGGFWGISRLASETAATRTQAAQLGTTYGGLQSAEASFGRLGGIDRILSGISQATHSVQGMAPLFSLMGPQAESLRGGDPAEVFAAILPRLKDLADKSEPGTLGNRVRAMGLDRLGISVETLKMLRGMSREEVADMVKTYRENRKKQELGAQAQKALTDFTRTLEMAGAKMAVIVGENLSHLTPIVGRVAESFARLLDKLLVEGGPVTKWLDALDKKILAFADWIESPEFLKAIDQFVMDVDGAASLFLAFGAKVGSIAGDAFSEYSHRAVRDALAPGGSTPHRSIWAPQTSTPKTPGGGETVGRRGWFWNSRPHGGGTPRAKGGNATPTTGEVTTGGESPEKAIVDIGHELQKEGLRVSEHPAFGGVHPVHHGRGHYEGRAIDVNFGSGVNEATDPVAGPKFDALSQQLRERGYTVIWRAPGHFNHMHVEVPRGKTITNPQLHGRENHVTVHDQSDGGSRVSVENQRIGPMRIGQMPSSGMRFPLRG